MVYRLHDSLGYRLTLAGRIQERRLDQGLKKLGLTRMSWAVLLAVGNEGLEQPSDIASFIGVDRSAISRTLKDMEAKGLIARMAGEGDARTRAIMLTDLGRDRVANGTPIAIRNNAVMYERLTEDEVARLKEMLDKLIEGEPALNKL